MVEGTEFSERDAAIVVDVHFAQHCANVLLGGVDESTLQANLPELCGTNVPTARRVRGVKLPLELAEVGHFWMLAVCCLLLVAVRCCRFE